MVNVAQLVRALDCGSKGRGFESHLSPQKAVRSLTSSLFFGLRTLIESGFVHQCCCRMVIYDGNCIRKNPL